MSNVSWQKSSFSSGNGNGECVEAASPAPGRVLLRESDEPEVVLESSRTALRGLLDWTKAQGAV